MAPQYVASFPLIECQCGARLGVSYTVPKPLHLQLSSQISLAVSGNKGD